jgi:hypothetical protein
MIPHAQAANPAPLLIARIDYLKLALIQPGVEI